MLRFLTRVMLSAILLVACAIPAMAQTTTAICIKGAGGSFGNSCPPVTPANPFPVNINPTMTWTQTIVTLTAATSATLLAANANRKALRWMVTGTNPVTIAPGLVTVTAGAGMNYSPPSGTGLGGGTDSFAGDTSAQAFSAISTLGTTVAVWEGQ